MPQRSRRPPLRLARRTSAGQRSADCWPRRNGVRPCGWTDRVHRSHSAGFKRQVVAEYHAGEIHHALSRRHDLSRNLIRIWVEKVEVGALDEDGAAAELLTDYEARIAAVERLVGRQTLEIEFLKGACAPDPRGEARLHPLPAAPRPLRPAGKRADGRRAVQLLRRPQGQAPGRRDHRGDPRHHRRFRGLRLSPRRCRAPPAERPSCIATC